MKFIRCNATNTDFKQLVSLLDADLKIRDGDDHNFYHQFNRLEQLKHVVLGYKDKNVIACGALKEYNSHTFEIKRMYVTDLFRGQGVASSLFRGQGVASSLLSELEQWSIELGFHTIVLETGINQPEAIALYKKNRYVQTQNYGQYKGIATSLCFEKTLSH